jgi:DNA-binding transcriptional LysR family regulator
MESDSTDRPEAFDWALVRSFVAVLDAGSLTAAARRTGMHQPTLSRHIAELEAQLQVPLFERTGRGVVPTAAALAIADDARRMQADAQALALVLAGRRAATTGTVRITTSHVAATWLLPPLLARLQAEEPGIQVELVGSDALSNLLRREADIAVRMVRPEQASLVARRLGLVGIGAYAHERYLRRAGVPESPEALLRHTLIGHVSNDVILRGFRAAGLPATRDSFALRTDDQVSYGRLVEVGAGIGFVPHLTARGWPGVRQVLPELAIPPLPCWLAVHREIRGNPVVRRVYDFLAEALQRQLRDQAA